MRTRYLQMLPALLSQNCFDALLLCPSEELRFFAGFSPLQCERFQGLVVKRNGAMFYFCNLLSGDEVRAESGGAFPVYTWFDNESMADRIREVFQREGLAGAAIAVNSSAQAFNILDIAAVTGARFGNGVALLEETRIRKTPEELDALRKAASIADEGFMQTLPQIHAGMTERQIHDILTEEMTRLGGSDAGALIASGPNAGYPHYSGGSRVVQPGDGIIMDFGCIWNGLHSDMTRTVFLNQAPLRAQTLYRLLYEAQSAAEQAAVEHAFIPDIDRAARNVLARGGYADACTTRVGHGIGYMTHEAPYISALNRRRLKRGMCFSIEPGIYLPGELGIRIEDIVAINLKGETEILNRAPKQLLCLEN